MPTKTFTYDAIPSIGEPIHIEETFSWKEGESTYWSLREGRCSMGYGDAGTPEKFEEWWINMQKSRVRDIEEMRRAEAERVNTLARFDAELAEPLEAILKGRSDAEEIVAAAREAARWHHAEPRLREVMAEPALAARKTLVAAYKEARALIRDENPEDYREADDKEDFYSDFADDIAFQFSRSL